MRRLLLSVLGVVALVAASCGDGGSSSPSTGAPAVEPTEIDGDALMASEKDVVYATWGDRTLSLDIYTPAETADASVFIYLPGRGEQAGPFRLIEALVDNGTMVFVVRYAASSFGPEEILGAGGVHLRAMADSVACAMHTVRDRAEQLGSPDPVVVLSGISLGAAPAAHAALAGTELERRWEEYATDGGPSRDIDCEVEAGSTHVDALVGIAGAYDMFVPAYDGRYGSGYQQELYPDQWQFLVGAVGLNPGLKVRLLHGTNDGTIPLENSIGFAMVLSEAGYDVELIEFDGGHTDPPTALTLSTIESLLGRST